MKASWPDCEILWLKAAMTPLLLTYKVMSLIFID